MRIYKYLTIGCGILFAIGCTDNKTTQDDVAPKAISVSTNKACYQPGETVTFQMDQTGSGQITVRYRHLNTILSTEAIHGNTWTWTPPATDFKGYLAEIYQKDADGHETVRGSIAVDVSSDWNKFPRYGFLSHYNNLTPEQIARNIERLNRYHINGVQYQDWHYKHHQPAAGTIQTPQQEWTDIANRTVEKTIVDGYIAETHKYGMKSIFYNLCFGVLKDAETDGVLPEWYLYKDKIQKERDMHALPSNWKSDIYLVNPGNQAWQEYLAKQNETVYGIFDFDGYQIDQLGNRGQLYDAHGQEVDLPAGYLSFIHAMKQAHPDKRLVMNAVSEYGQEQIAQGEVDFFYNEVWADAPRFVDLSRILENNYQLNSKLATVFAAYMNYNVADAKGFFNTPGVLLTDAVMFALGASHLELGEHMLCKEYFPNNNLQMKPELEAALIAYYDFLVAYQNLLRDGGDFCNVSVTPAGGSTKYTTWPPQYGCVTALGKDMGHSLVLHLLNTSNADKLDWRDTDGTQPEPLLLKQEKLHISTNRPVKHIWMASPDFNHGIPCNIDFEQDGARVTIELPSLKYWDMVVLEW